LFVIGTSGHVDHGKSTLIQALTGIDPDRLKEEKERGMTIDLGFAWMTLDSGVEVSIIDVPGHERFVNNMLAGIGGIDIALLVIAADESIMPQTKEHFEILNLLNVKNSIVVLTKIDQVEAEWINMVQEEVKEFISKSPMENSPIYPVSAITGEGIPALLNGIDNYLKNVTARKNLMKPRMSIDRSFTVVGFGTVVTGTLIEGSLKVGDSVRVLPSGITSRIRGLQTHKESQVEVFPGTRVAVNLSGVEHNTIRRGDLLLTSDLVSNTTAIDAQLKVLEDCPQNIRHNMFVTLHVGSSESIARLRLLNDDLLSPGQYGWVQLKLENPLPIFKGDYFVVRSNMNTLGGGIVLGINAKRHSRGDKITIDSLSSLMFGEPEDIILQSLNLTKNYDINNLLEETQIELKSLSDSITKLLNNGLIVSTSKNINYALLFTLSDWNDICGKITRIISEYHQEFPMRIGVAIEQLKSKSLLNNDISIAVINNFVERGIILIESSFVKLAGFNPCLSERDKQIASYFIQSLRDSPYNPPFDETIHTEILGFLVMEKQILKISENMYFDYNVYLKIVDVVREHLHANEKLTVAKFRDLFSTTRKYALACLEYMDTQQITKRVEDYRILR